MPGNRRRDSAMSPSTSRQRLVVEHGLGKKGEQPFFESPEKARRKHVSLGEGGDRRNWKWKGSVGGEVLHLLLCHLPGFGGDVKVRCH